jgi:hypothetical protein
MNEGSSTTTTNDEFKDKVKQLTLLKGERECIICKWYIMNTKAPSLSHLLCDMIRTYERTNVDNNHDVLSSSIRLACCKNVINTTPEEDEELLMITNDDIFEHIEKSHFSLVDYQIRKSIEEWIDIFGEVNIVTLSGQRNNAMIKRFFYLTDERNRNSIKALYTLLLNNLNGINNVFILNTQSKWRDMEFLLAQKIFMKEMDVEHIPIFKVVLEWFREIIKYINVNGQ